MKNKIVALVLLLIMTNHTLAHDFNIVENSIKYNYVSINSEHTVHPIAAKLSIPKIKDGSKPPVVIIAHGSGGVDERGFLYAQKLNEVGIATIEIDMWSARNMSGGLSRPDNVQETLSDITDTISYLNSNQNIDNTRIGMLGFSWGGVMSMLLSTKEYSTPQSLKAIVANYPVCWVYNTLPEYEFRSLRDDMKLLIISGSKDKYDSPKDCSNLVKKLDNESAKSVTTLQLEQATHAFDLKKPSSKFYDPFAYQGKGGNVPIEYNKAKTEQSTASVVLFFQHSL